jgi:phosphatidylglycerol lysyltransferase
LPDSWKAYARMKKSLIHTFGYLISLCLFIVALLVLYRELKQYHFHDIVAGLKAVKPLFLTIAGLLTLLDYLVLTLYDALALRYIKYKLEYAKIVLASFIGYVFSHNMTIVGGSTARYRIYSALGVSASEVAKLVIFCGLTFWLGFFAVCGIVFVAEPNDIPAALHIPFATARPVGVIFIAMTLAYLIFVILRRRSFIFREWEFTIPSFPISIGQIVIASIDWLLACGVLYALLPAATELTFMKFVGLFMLAQAAGLLSYVPGGLGVFEAIILLLLSDYLEKTSIISSLVLYRLIYYLIPFILATVLLAVNELAAKKPALKRFGIVLGKWSPAVVPNVFAIGSFIAGVILLFSGSLPSVRGRLEFLTDFLPLPAIEISHFLGSIAGAGLLILARGLQRRISSAYFITAGLLVAGIMFSLFKGLDYEEAIILTIMLLAILPCRKEFYRKTSLLAERFSPAWIISIIAVIACCIWLGMFSYKHVEYSNSLWWRFALNADAPRFLRAVTAGTIVILLYFLAKLQFSSKTVTVPDDAGQLAKAEHIVRSCPKTYAWLALLGDKNFLFDENQSAFIMYAVRGRSWVAMGDPVGPEEQMRELIWDFRELCDRYSGWPVFYLVEKEYLDFYVELGLTFVKLGEEARVNLQEFTLTGASHSGLRHSRNKIERENCLFSIIMPQDVPGILPHLKEVSDQWLEEKKTNEKRFSLGFFSPEYLSKTPIAVVSRNNDIIAFANILIGAEKEELSIDLMRFLPSSPEGIMDYLFIELLLWGKQQDYKWFNFGMAPLSGIEDRALAPLWTHAGAFIFRYGEHFYNFQGLRKYKEKFDPEWHPKYLACPKGLMLPRILANIASVISGGIKGIVMK